MLLIIDKSLKNARMISDIFYYMGILSYPTTPERALNELSNRHRAILITDLEDTQLSDEYIKSLHAFSLGSSVFAICRDKKKYLQEHSPSPQIDGYFDDRTFSSTLYEAIYKYQRERKMKPIGIYRLAGIDASVHLPYITYYDTPMKFTKTETMIIRYLIRAYPAASKPKDIMKYAFKISKMPELSNIRTHISVINKKFRSENGKPLIINESGQGYSILTPIKERDLGLNLTLKK